MASYQVKQSSTAYPLVFLMVQSSDHVTGLTGASPTVTLSKAGGSFASPSGAVSEIANGWYKVAGNATDTATLGPLALHATATSGDPVDVLYEVVAVDPQDSVRHGLTALPNAAAGANTGLPVVGTQVPNATVATAGGLPTIGTGSGQIQPSGTGQIGLDFSNIKAATIPTTLTNVTVPTVTNVTNGVTLASNLKKGQALAGFQFYMSLSSDHVSPATGKVITATRSLDGNAFQACANNASEIGNGWYAINLDAADTNGNTVALSFAASSCDTTLVTLVTQP